MSAERDALAELVAAQDADEMGDPEAWVARWYVAWAAARAALAAPPAVSVPREPTQAMLVAGHKQIRDPVLHWMPWAIWRAMWDAAQPDNDQTGREGNKAGTSAEQSTHGCKAPTQGEFAEYLAPDPTAAPAQERDWATINSVCDDGQAAPAQGEPQDYAALIARLRNGPGFENSLHIDRFAAADAIDALRADLDGMIRNAAFLQSQINTQRQRAEKSEAECERLRADAERYRHIRDYPWGEELHTIIIRHQNTLWDAAIDAARGTG